MEPDTLTSLDVIMPVFNEENTVAEAISKVLSVEIPGVHITLTVVESNSTDETASILRTFEGHERITLLFQDHARGKGYAVREGIAETKGDILLIQDADLEYSVDDYETLLRPLLMKQYDFVIGKRDATVNSMRHFPTQPLVSRFMNVGHLIFRSLFNFSFGTDLHDPFSMYKVFRRECINGIRFRANRFDFDWELVGKLALRGYVPLEIPVSYESRSFHEGKKVRLFRDPFTWFWVCIQTRLWPCDWRVANIESGFETDEKEK